MDECLRAASGFQGADDRLEFRLMDIQQVSDKTRTKRVSSAPCFELQQGLDTSNSLSDVDNSVGVALWNEAIERHLPVALSHSFPLVITYTNFYLRLFFLGFYVHMVSIKEEIPIFL
jgi:hypothetical protein